MPTLQMEKLSNSCHLMQTITGGLTFVPELQ